MKFRFIEQKTKLSQRQIKVVAELLEEGATVPFIARYRKEATGSLDEVEITAIRDALTEWIEFDKRRTTIYKSLESRELLTADLRAQLEAVTSLSELEDIYLPFRPKRRTRAMMAREKGLEPLAKIIWQQSSGYLDAKPFINRSKGVNSADDAMAGAQDIVAEWISEQPNVRATLRELFFQKSILTTKVADKTHREFNKFRDYTACQELLVKMPSHRFLAIMRAESLGIIKVKVAPDEKQALYLLQKLVVTSGSFASHKVKEAAQDAYKRLLAPSLENETLKQHKLQADTEAIRVFANNISGLLLAAPAGEKNVLAIDPGFRTGCKCAVLDRLGRFVHFTTIYPFDKKSKSQGTIQQLCQEYNIDLIAVGNGTAGRETEMFIETCDLGIPSISTDESGASIYSASEVARQEFPDLDLTVRGAISIGRRLQDPLSELVKLDPASIGVGQYQHDVDQKLLKHKLDDVVKHCVNTVGVDLNQASEQLLTYVSGLGSQLAKNIVQYRYENGAFKSRAQLKKVPRLGAKVFEQASAFLRIRDGKNPLDNTAVHPERYKLVEHMAQNLCCKPSDLIENSELCQQLNLTDYIDQSVGLPTLKDIIAELLKPGRDPRPKFEVFNFSQHVHTINDLIIGMELPGIVTNVTKFGAFVDIGVHQDGLVHISQLANTFVKDPSDVVSVRQQVTVKVLEVDVDRKRIALSMR